MPKAAPYLRNTPTIRQIELLPYTALRARTRLLIELVLLLIEYKLFEKL